MTAALILWLAVRKFCGGLFADPMGRWLVIGGAAVAAFLGYSTFEQHKGVLRERTRQETTDATIARAALSHLHAASARRLLDPTTTD